MIFETAGRRFEHSRRHARGGLDEPLDDDEVERKYRELAEPVLGASGAARVRDLVDSLETLDTLTPLTSALTPEGGASR